MTASRENFEAWATRRLGQGYSLEKDEGVYINPVTRWAEKAYHAATERAAKLCAAAEISPVIDDQDRLFNYAVNHCAAAIRGAEKEGAKGS